MPPGPCERCAQQHPRCLIVPAWQVTGAGMPRSGGDVSRAAKRTMSSAMFHWQMPVACHAWLFAAMETTEGHVLCVPFRNETPAAPGLCRSACLNDMRAASMCPASANSIPLGTCCHLTHCTMDRQARLHNRPAHSCKRACPRQAAGLLRWHMSPHRLPLGECVNKEQGVLKLGQLSATAL